MSGTQDLSLYLAFAAGLLSFLSPCVLPLVPSYLAFITGLSFEELTHEDPRSSKRKTILVHSLLFILGFSVLFTALGASATFIGQFLSSHRETIRIAGGVMIILFGLFIGGFISLGFLQRETTAWNRQTDRKRTRINWKFTRRKARKTFRYNKTARRGRTP